MIFELNSRVDIKIKRGYEKSMAELGKFFGINWTRNRPRIVLMKNRKTIDLFREKKTPDWLVGWVGGRAIYILDKKGYEKESCHKYSDQEYSRLIKHELAHLFFQIAAKKDICQPDWLWEGTAMFLDGGYPRRRKIIRFTEFLDYYKKSGPGVYKESGFAIRLLVNNYGKQKLLQLVKSLKDAKNQTQFNKLFKKIYKFTPTYKKFNEMLKNDRN